MWKNYLLTALRNTRKRKLISFINTLSLTLGIAVCLLVYLFIHDELTFDHFHSNKDRIYRINSAYFMEALGEWKNSSGTSPAMRNYYKDLVPGFEEVVRVDGSSTSIRVKEEFFNQSFVFADDGLFNVFDFPLISGSIQQFNTNPSALIIDESTAKVWFEENEAVGKIVDFTFNGEIHPMEIVGVIKDVPHNSSVRFNVLVPFSKYEKVANPERITSLFDLHISTFALGREGTAIEELQAQLEKAFQTFATEEDLRIFKTDLQPLTDLHLNDDISGGNGVGNSTSISISFILGGIGFLILIIGCFNYVNLSFGVLLGRVKEIGIRKVIGAGKRHLITQYILETLVITIFAFGLAILAVDLILPYFERLSGKSFGGFSNFPDLILFLVAPLFFIIISISVYPAFISSGFSTISALKGNEKIGGRTSFSKFLVVLQFSIGVICTIVFLTVNRQLNYITDFNLGYNDRNIITAALPGPEQEKAFEQLKQALSTHAQVISITGNSNDHSRTNLEFQGQKYIITHDRITPEYIETFDIEVIEGKDFNAATEQSENTVLVNQAFVEELKLEDPIGQQLNYVGFDVRITGVVNNYHFQSLHQQVTPLLLHLNIYRPVARIFIKTSPSGTFEVLEEFKVAWKKILPMAPLSYTFVEDENILLYQQEQQAREVLTWATSLALFISCLGLFGLASLHIQQRTKEVSIKKVLGASISRLAQDLSRDFTLLILIGWAIAIPVGVWLSNKWLEQFTYKVELSWLLFIIIGFIILMIGLATISYHVIKTARVNPAETLKNE